MEQVRRGFVIVPVGALVIGGGGQCIRLHAGAGLAGAVVKLPQLRADCGLLAGLDALPVLLPLLERVEQAGKQQLFQLFALLLFGHALEVDLFALGGDLLRGVGQRQDGAALFGGVILRVDFVVNNFVVGHVKRSFACCVGVRGDLPAGCRGSGAGLLCGAALLECPAVAHAVYIWRNRSSAPISAALCCAASFAAALSWPLKWYASE